MSSCRRFATALWLACWAWPLAAQPGAPTFTAPPGSAQVKPTKAPRVDILQLGHDAVELYRRVCTASAGDLAALVDLALAAGLQPYQGEGDSSASALLGGGAGQVYTPPGRGAQLQLALANDGRCTVWAQQAEGPRVRAGFLALIESLRGLPGVSLRPTQDRVIERGGGWRQQLGFELREARGLRQFDAVTMVSQQPGVQVLSSAPLAATGVPR